jgi:hypothetical protein
MEPATSIPPDASSDAESRRRGHETTDARLRPIIVFIVVMILAAGLIQLAVLALMHFLRHHNAAADPTPSPFADQRAAPPEPRLQPSLTHPTQPHEDMATLHARWQQQLTTYGKIPGDTGHARIPITRAMQLMIQTGVKVDAPPTTKPAPHPVTQPASTPGGDE